MPKHDDELRARAIKDFENHEIRKQSEGRYLLQRRHSDGDGWDSIYAAEILLGYANTIYVGGDISACVFAYGPTDHRARIAWMGGCNDVGYYVAQKASIGGTKTVTVWSCELALSEMRDRLSECYEEEEYEDLRKAMLEGTSAPLAKDTHYFSLHDMLESIRDAIPEGYSGFLDDTYEVGDATSPAVYYAWAALRKLHLLLLDKDE